MSETLPSTVTAAVLVPSDELPADAQTVEELDFNAYAGRSITVDDLVSGTANMGFQATSIGQAIRIINDMVSTARMSKSALGAFFFDGGDVATVA